jgi:S-adenosylmethionine-diacylglycerol 3-amino-3-carboxypropyl transferase
VNLFVGSTRGSRDQLAAAVHQNDALTKEGMLERLFTFLFSGLVYPQIWEDPVVDMDARCLGRSDRLIVIASGGCNVASYLVAQPQQIIAVDLNASHVALNRLKLTAIQYLPSYAALYRFFAGAADTKNVDAYDRILASHLDAQSRAYWEQRDWLGRRHITRFARGFYSYGLLGHFIGFVHALSRLHGFKIDKILKAKTQDEQIAIFEKDIAPLFDRWLIRSLAGQPASLYGLGIPPAQYRALAGDHREGMVGALRERVRRLACDYPLTENYFAWQAFGRAYSTASEGPLPPYLLQANYERIRAAAERVEVIQISMTKQLASMPADSMDCYVLLDAQDWMNDADLNALWAQITRTARPGARVIFRTAANELLLPGRVADETLRHWARNDARSEALHARDRSAIYGAFHLYELKGGHNV